jgi:hypothetical protein
MNNGPIEDAWVTPCTIVKVKFTHTRVFTESDATISPT